MGRTQRDRRKEKKRQKRLEQEISRRVEAGEPVLALTVGPKTKTRKPRVYLGEKVSAEWLTRRTKLLAFLRERH